MASFEGRPIPRTAGPPLLTPSALGPVPTPPRSLQPPSAAPAAPPAKPKTRLEYKQEAYDQIRKNPPKVPYPPGTTPQQHAKDVSDAMQRWEKEVEFARRDYEFEVSRPGKEAAGKIKTAQAGRIDRDLALKAGLTQEQINNLQATSANTRALTPVRTEKGRVDIGVQRERAKAIPKQVQLEERRTVTGETAVKLSAGQLALAQKREARLAEQARKALAIKANTDEEKRLQQEINNEFKVFTAQADIKKFDRYSNPRRLQAQDKIEKNLARLREIRAKGTKAAPEGGGGATDNNLRRDRLLREMDRRGYSKALKAQRLKEAGF
jgi:hypothetical protein